MLCQALTHSYPAPPERPYNVRRFVLRVVGTRQQGEGTPHQQLENNLKPKMQQNEQVTEKASITGQKPRGCAKRQSQCAEDRPSHARNACLAGAGLGVVPLGVQGAVRRE